MRVSPLLFVLLAGLASGCATEEPFVDPGTAVTVQKAQNTVVTSGLVDICHTDRTPWNQVVALAEEQCASYGLKALQTQTQRWQCRATNPHRTGFFCVDPDMRNANGSYVNPFSRLAVQDWEKLTGKTAPAHRTARGPVVSPPAPAKAEPDALSGPAAPPPAPLTPPSALTPADIAGKPAMPSQPPRMDAPPPPPPAPVDGGFKLPVGSWGDSFEQ